MLMALKANERVGCVGTVGDLMCAVIGSQWSVIAVMSITSKRLIKWLVSRSESTDQLRVKTLKKSLFDKMDLSLPSASGSGGSDEDKNVKEAIKKGKIKDQWSKEREKELKKVVKHMEELVKMIDDLYPTADAPRLIFIHLYGLSFHWY